MNFKNPFRRKQKIESQPMVSETLYKTALFAAREANEARIAAVKEAQFYRAQLMQLRIENAPPENRQAWMVSALIPNEVLANVRRSESMKLMLIDTVAKALVKAALDGIFRLKPDGQKVQAVLYGSLMKDAKNGQMSVDLIPVTKKMTEHIEHEGTKVLRS